MMVSTASGRRASTAAVSVAQVAEQLCFADDSGLDDFVQTGAIFALGKRLQHRGIDQHGQRLMEAADQILPAHQIDAGLAADGRIHLRQQRGGDLQDGNAAHEDGRQKTGHVGDDAAAERDHHAGAIAPAMHHLLRQLFHGSEPLAIFAARKIQRFVWYAGQRAGQGIALVPPYVFGGHYEYLAVLRGQLLRGMANRSAKHNRRITVLRRFDAVGGHTPFVPRSEGRTGSPCYDRSNAWILTFW